MIAFDAIYSNNIQALTEYLSKGDVNVKNERGLSLIHYAITFSNSDIFNLLLDNYIDVNIQDSNGETAAHYCVIYNKIGFLKTLIKKGADLNIKNEDGQTPLFKACTMGREEILSLLLENDQFDLYDRDSKDETIFMAIVKSRNLDLLARLNLDDKIIDIKNFSGESPLHIAARAGDPKVLLFLLKAGSYVNAKNNQKETPLFYAVRSQNREAIDLLLRYGALLDCRSVFGETIYNIVPSYELSNYINEKNEQYETYKYVTTYPLHYAIVTENYPRVAKLKGQISVDKKDNFGFTPVELAEKIGNERILRTIKDFR